MSDQAPKKQLLHLVLGGELTHLDDIEYMLLELGAKDGAEIARRPQTDTLVRIYGIFMAGSHDASILARRAMLATRFPEFYAKEALPWLREAMEAVGFKGIRTEWWHFSYQSKNWPLSDYVWPCE